MHLLETEKAWWFCRSLLFNYIPVLELRNLISVVNWYKRCIRHFKSHCKCEACQVDGYCAGWNECVCGSGLERAGVEELISAVPCSFDHARLFQMLQKRTLVHRMDDSFSCLVSSTCLFVFVFFWMWARVGTVYKKKALLEYIFL